MSVIERTTRRFAKSFTGTEATTTAEATKKLMATRRVAEAVRACGGVDAFLQHLDLVAGIRSPESAG